MQAIDFFSQMVKCLLIHHHQRMNVKATDESEVILPFERRSQSLSEVWSRSHQPEAIIAHPPLFATRAFATLLLSESSAPRLWLVFSLSETRMGRENVRFKWFAVKVKRKREFLGPVLVLRRRARST